MGRDSVSAGYNGREMATKRRKKSAKPPPTTKRSGTRYTPAEIAMAVLGAAILVLIGGIIVTSILQ